MVSVVSLHLLLYSYQQLISVPDIISNKTLSWGRNLALRDFELGAIRIHILYHASRAPIYGSWMAEELERHGYKVSYGVLYPALHRMEEDELLVREDRVEGGRMRK